MMLATAVLAFVFFNFSISAIKPGGLEEGLTYAIIVELSPIFFSQENMIQACYINVLFTRSGHTDSP